MTDPINTLPCPPFDYDKFLLHVGTIILPLLGYTEKEISIGIEHRIAAGVGLKIHLTAFSSSQKTVFTCSGINESDCAQNLINNICAEYILVPKSAVTRVDDENCPPHRIH